MKTPFIPPKLEYARRAEFGVFGPYFVNETINSAMATDGYNFLILFRY